MADPMVTDEERAFHAAVHEALTGTGKFPTGHEHAGMTLAEAYKKAERERQGEEKAIERPETPKQKGKPSLLAVKDADAASQG